MKIDKLFNRYALVGVAAMMLASCNNDDESVAWQDGNVVLLSGEVQSVQTRATSTAFEADDAVGLYAMVWDDATPSASVPLGTAALYADNLQLLWGEGGGFSYASEDAKLYWPSLKRNLDVYAYYPYNSAGLTANSSLLPVTVEADQSAGLSKSDVMTARLQGVEKSTSAVNLVFKHALCKLHVALVAGEGYQDADIEGTTVKFINVMTSTTLDLSKLPSDEGFAGTATVSGTIAAKNGEAIIVPQQIAEGTAFVEVYDREGKKMTETKAVVDKNTFVSGNQYNITITLKKKGITVSGDITDWTVLDNFISQDEYQTIELTTDNGSLTEGNIAFANGAKIGLFASKWENADSEGTLATYLTNHELTWGSTGFTGNAIYWPTAKRNLNLYAYAPYQSDMAITGTQIPISVNQNQDITDATDWLIANKQGVERTSGKVIFNFAHALSKVHVTLTYGDGYTDDLIEGVNVKMNNIYVDATANLKSKAVSVATGASANVVALKKTSADALEFACAFPPQTTNSKTLLIYDKEGKLAASLQLADNKTFESGKEYKLTVNLKKNGLVFTADIAKWESVDWGTSDANQEWGN